MAITKQVEFENGRGIRLAATLHLPTGPYQGAAVFAHCFTCSRQSRAAVRISSELAASGLAVLRFDFTGLGRSGGEFSETSFTSNLDDLDAACSWMASQHLGAHSLQPHLLVGHSLGGAAVLAAAGRRDDIRAVATIGAPSAAQHVSHLFDSHSAEIEAYGKAKVDIGGRPFEIGQQLVTDLKAYANTEHLSRLSADTLIMHAPQDAIVGIDEAALIYTSLRHPKSFVSLDRADHLLSQAEDAEFAAGVISAWARRALRQTAPDISVAPEGRVIVTGSADGLFAQDIAAGRHMMRADEPARIPGGLDSGAAPYDFLLAGLGACTAMTLRMYAERKKWPIDDVQVTLTHQKIHANDMQGSQAGAAPVRLDRMERIIRISGELTDLQKDRLLEIADKCPVHLSLDAGIDVCTSLET